MQVDHENDSQIFNLFQKIQIEQNGRLDILVNNAYKGVEVMLTFNNCYFLCSLKTRIEFVGYIL